MEEAVVVVASAVEVEPSSSFEVEGHSDQVQLQVQRPVAKKTQILSKMNVTLKR